MIELKVQCDCGQKFKFDVEPINGRMPFAVNCPLCGLDGTHKANALLQQMPPAPVAQQFSAPPAAVSPPPIPSGLRIGGSAAAAPAPPRPIAAAPGTAPRPMAARPQPQKGNDGWATSETSFNKLGSYIMLIPSIIGALLAAGFFGIQLPPMILGVIVGVCGVIGGTINIMGRGPIAVGMVVGVVMALGGYGAVFWWIQDRGSVRKFEVALAFLIGAAPGYGLQFLFQKILLKRKQSATA